MGQLWALVNETSATTLLHPAEVKVAISASSLDSLAPLKSPEVLLEIEARFFWNYDDGLRNGRRRRY
jgi:hypothetical protein